MNQQRAVQRGFAACFVILFAFLLAACGGGGGGTPATATSAAVTGLDSNTPLVVGQAKALTPTATFDNGSTRDLQATDVTWASSDPAIATVDASGTIHGVAPGTATITFTYQKVSGTANVTVVPRKLTAIQLTADKTSVPAGASIQVAAHGTFNDQTSEVLKAADGVTFASSDPAIAKFSTSTFGQLQTLAPGSATVTAQNADGIKGTLSITVGAAQLAQIMVTPAQTTTPAGVPLQLTAAGNYTNSSTQDITASVTWAVTGIANAAVAADGKLTAPAPGTATVTAALDGVTSSPVDITVSAAVLQSVKIMGGNTSLAKGQTGAATLNGTFSDGTQHTVTADSWTSSDTSVLTVDASGNLKAVGVGSATLTGANQGFSDSLQYTVTPAVVTKINVTLASAQVPAGLTTQASAQATYSDATTADLTSQVVWASSDNTLATVDASGKVSAKAKGSTDISATYQSVSGKTTLTVTDATLQSVKISAPDLSGGQISRAKGLTEQASLTGTFSDGSMAPLDNSKVSWSVADASIASVTPAGLVTFLKEGTTTLTGTSGSATDSAQLTTTAAIPVSLQISGPTSVPAGTSASYTAAVLFSDSTTANLTATAAWSSSNTSKATIVSGGTSSGQLQALRDGSVTITAQATQNGTALTGTTSITVTPSSFIVGGFSSSGSGTLVVSSSGLGVAEVTNTGTLFNAAINFIASGRNWTIVSSTITSGTQVFHNTADEGSVLAPGSYQILVPPNLGPRHGNWVMTTLDNAGNEVPFLDVTY